MKRWPRRISPRRAAFGGTICLILGVVTTVGVAWAIVINPDVRASWLEPSGSNNYGGFFVSHDRQLADRGAHSFQSNPGRVGIAYSPGINASWMVGRIDAERYTAELPSWSRFRDPPSVWQTYAQVWTRGRSVSYHELAAGWPMRAMGSSYLWARDSDNIDSGPYHIAVGALGAPLSIELGDDREVDLPLRPVFPDFLINTLFYAAIWFGLFFATGMTRRFIRTRRRRCPRCGYDLRGELNDGCPECGWGRGSD